MLQRVFYAPQKGPPMNIAGRPGQHHESAASYYLAMVLLSTGLLSPGGILF
jgi:hypothetical protein